MGRSNGRGRRLLVGALLVTVTALLLGLPAVAGAPLAEDPYVPLVPTRIFDTRTGTGGVRRPIGPGETRDGLVLGVGGVPASGVAAVVLNLTAVGATTETFITEWPAGRPRPTASTLNPRPGGAYPNLVVAQVGEGGRISLFNGAGSVEVFADVVGYHAASSYTGLVPSRVLDTRLGLGGVQRPVGPGETRDALVLGVGGVPAAGVAAVVLNLTAADASTPSFVTEWPTGHPRPAASALNPQPGGAYPNLVVTQVGHGGRISLFNQKGTVDLLADIVGYYPDPSGYTALDPSRILDTRTGQGGGKLPLGPGQTREAPVLGVGGVPATGVGAVVLNLTAAGATADTFVTEWPTGSLRPVASTLNPRPGGAQPNLVVARVGQGGRISLFNQNGTVDLVADVVGFYPTDLAAGPSAPAWVRQLDTIGGSSATAVAVDPEGGAVVAGGTSGTLPGSPERFGGRSDAAVVKYGPYGEVRWAHQLNGTAYEWATSVAVDATGGVTVAGLNEDGPLPGAPEANQGGADAFVARYDASGTRQWVHLLGGTASDQAKGVAVDGTGNAYVVGRTDGGILPASTGPSGWANVFLAKYAPDGALRWVRVLGTDDGQDAYGVAVGPDGNVVVTGHSEDTMPGSPETDRGGSDVFVAKLDTSGQQLWVHQLGGEQNDHPDGITVDPSGDVIVTGTTAGSMDGAPEARGGGYDGWVARLDPAGNRRWIHQFGGSAWDVAGGVALGPSGTVYVTGSTDGRPEVWEVFPATYNAFLTAYSASGTRLWSTPLGTARLDMSMGVAVDPLSRVFIAGVTAGTLPGSPDLNTSGSDGFVAMYRTWPAAG